MNARLLIVALGGAVFGGIVGVLGFVWVVGGGGEASAPISAPTLDVNAVATLSPTQAFAAVTQVALLGTQVNDLQATIDALNAAAGQVIVVDADAANDDLQPTPVAAEPSSRTLYRIDPANSLVTFTLQEDLRGERIDVVGTTTEVAGDIIIDTANPTTSQIGTIRINARTLATDSEFRNRALRSEILMSAQDAYEFIEFVPTAVNGLPTSITTGETYLFEITGDLTIAGQTQPVTFVAEVTPQSEATLSGSAQATIMYADWGITIPNAPGVANVTEDVTLSINFVANQVEA